MDPQGIESPKPIPTPEVSRQVDINTEFPLHSITVDKGNIKFRDINPDNPRTPENRPLLMMTGWAMNQEIVGNTVSGLHEAGVHPVPVDFEGSTLSIDNDAEMLAALLKARKEAKVDVLGQSMAAVTILSMIDKHPDLKEKIGNVLLISPMGLGGKDSLLGLIRRQSAETKRNNAREKTEEDKKIEPQVAEAFKKFITRNPITAIK